MLKSSGVQTFVIGTKMSNSAEMQLISNDPNNVYPVPDFANLHQIEESLIGKLRPKRVLEKPNTVERPTTGKDIVFLLDGSDRTKGSFPALQTFVRRMVETLSIDDSSDRVSVVQYSKEPTVEFLLNTYSTKREILDHMDGLRHRGGRPLNTGTALQYLRENVFTTPAGSRRLEGVAQVLVILTDGRSSDSVNASAAALKDLGVLTFAIGAMNSDFKELQYISYDPSYAISLPEFNELQSVQEKIQSKIEALIVDESPETTSSTADIQGRDIVFLLDGSDEARNGFPAMQNFVERMVEKLQVGDNEDRVSVVQYSRDAQVHFYLNTFSTTEDVADSVRALRHKGGRSLNTGAALQFVKDNVFTESSGSRQLQGVPQILILVNGGRSSDNVDTPASNLKQQGIYVIGIGTQRSDSRELEKVSFDPRYALSVANFADLPNIQEQLSSVISTMAMEAAPAKPTETVDKKFTGRDVVFLLDGSDNTRARFPAMRDFVQRVIETLRVDDKKDRVSVVQYSREPTVNFYLNTYTSKGDILNTVRSLSHKGGKPLNTGAALQYLKDSVFVPSAGSRRLEGVAQVLVLLSGGRSSDNVEAPAFALKELGVKTFAIGSRNADNEEMRKISSDPSTALIVSDFNELPRVQQQLQSSLEAPTDGVTPKPPVPPGTLKFTRIEK
ncbi:collagen alpha-3(VI) chain-like [Synchiropus picturatus]